MSRAAIAAATTRELEEACPLEPGDALAGRYVVERLIGEGAFGWVFAALDVEGALPRRVALKVLRPGGGGHERALSRFERRELALLVRVHAAGPAPNIVRPLQPRLHWHEGLAFLVLELISGPSLREVMARGSMDEARVRKIGAGLARGLMALHAVGGVHRDIKPTNVRLREDDEPVLVDLGIALALWESQELTTDRWVPMTPGYASPEQGRGGRVGPPSDIYSLGVVLWELLKGERPEPSPGAWTQARWWRLGLWDRLWRSELEQVLLDCLRLDQTRRPTASELALALSAPPEASAEDGGG